MCHSLKKMVRADSSCSLLTGQPHPAAFWKATQCCHVRANSDAGRDWLRTTRDAPLTPLLGEIKGFANCQELGTKIKSYFLGSHTPYNSSNHPEGSIFLEWAFPLHRQPIYMEIN
jgi:hypothetical protein